MRGLFVEFLCNLTVEIRNFNDAVTDDFDGHFFVRDCRCERCLSENRFE